MNLSPEDITASTDRSAPIPISLTRIRPENRGQMPQPGTPLGFGRYFSDHLFRAAFSPAKGWHSASVGPRCALALDPAALCLHYGQTIFEGLKVFRAKDGRVLAFRLDKSARRFANSARRLAMPPVPEDLYRRAVASLALTDQSWIPEGKGEALYLRPVMAAVDASIGVKPGTEFLFYILAGPSGAFFANDFKPVSILVEAEDVRAVRGGLGEAKTGANYAHSLLAQKRAMEAGFAQVLWLDALERRWVEEVGTMNIFFAIGGELCTPPLTGTILPGITRDSILTLARSFGLTVRERPISIGEIESAASNGILSEAFGTGTAAIVSPIASFSYKGRTIRVGDGATGPIARRLFDAISAIQRGFAPDTFGWTSDLSALSLSDVLSGAEAPAPLSAESRKNR